MASLLSEVVPNLELDHIFKSGEQLYFGRKTIYSNIVTESKASSSVFIIFFWHKSKYKTYIIYM